MRKLRLVSVIIILIIASLMVASGFLFAFMWSVSNGQFEDDVSPSIRILFEDNIDNTSTSNSQNK